MSNFLATKSLRYWCSELGVSEAWQPPLCNLPWGPKKHLVSLTGAHALDPGAPPGPSKILHFQAFLAISGLRGLLAAFGASPEASGERFLTLRSLQGAIFEPPERPGKRFVSLQSLPEASGPHLREPPGWPIIRYTSPLHHLATAILRYTSPLRHFATAFPNQGGRRHGDETLDKMKAKGTSNH